MHIVKNSAELFALHFKRTCKARSTAENRSAVESGDASIARLARQFNAKDLFISFARDEHYADSAILFADGSVAVCDWNWSGADVYASEAAADAAYAALKL